MEALYIEDDPAQQRLMFLYLADLDIYLHLANTGNDGWALARKVLPSFIIIDLFLPDLDGDALLKLLKEDALLKEIPVIIVTADLLLHEKFDISGKGAVACLIKPVSKSKITGILEQIF